METNIIIAGVLVLVLLIVAGVFIFHKKDNYIPTTNPAPTQFAYTTNDNPYGFIANDNPYGFIDL